MNKKFKIGSLIALAVAILLVIVTNIIHKASEKNLVMLEEQVTYLTEEFTPMEFEISKYNDGVIKLKTVFYDMDGKKVGSDNINLKGNELNFDFNVIKLNEGSYLFFPCGLYTEDMALVDSYKVFDAYTKDEFPLIYRGLVDVKDTEGNKINKESKESIENEIKTYFNITKNGEVANAATPMHGVAVHDIKNVNSFKKGFIYKVICHPHTGAVEIVRR